MAIIAKLGNGLFGAGTTVARNPTSTAAPVTHPIFGGIVSIVARRTHTAPTKIAPIRHPIARPAGAGRTGTI